MIHQLDINGRDKVEVAIMRLKTFEPPEGYYLAFSGGKDSVVCKALCDMAGVKYDAHYNITSVDPPELVQFVKTFHDVKREHQYWKSDGKHHKAGDPITMWNLIAEKTMPPTRLARYCCQHLKEGSGHDRFVITGVRHAESTARGNRGGVEVGDKSSRSDRRERIDPDNPDQEMIHICQMKKQRILNPIIDWTDDEVWEFIREYNVPYCKLYDEGYKRLGCIGCPMGSPEHRQNELNRFPTYKRAYLKAFEKMLANKKEPDEEKMGKSYSGKQYVINWVDANAVLNWWIH